MEKLCPGLYCGRILYDNGSFSECGACPIGYRTDENRECVQCLNNPNSYDMMFLGFMFMLPLILHFYFINNCCENFKQHAILIGSAIFELITSAAISILLMDPVGSFRLNTCEVKQFSDWYTLFYNPTPNYWNKLHCTQEAVYPLQTIVLVFYFISLLQMIIMRTLLSNILGIHKKQAIYCALYFLPLLMFLHSITCGLIYYGFPYLSIIISMITNAWHQSIRSDRLVQPSLNNTSCVPKVKNCLIIGGHWFLLAYGIIALRHHFMFLLLVPFPLLFYMITVHFTDPSEFLECEERGI